MGSLPLRWSNTVVKLVLILQFHESRENVRGGIGVSCKQCHWYCRRCRISMEVSFTFLKRLSLNAWMMHWRDILLSLKHRRKHLYGTESRYLIRSMQWNIQIFKHWNEKKKRGSCSAIQNTTHAHRCHLWQREGDSNSVLDFQVFGVIGLLLGDGRWLLGCIQMVANRLLWLKVATVRHHWVVVAVVANTTLLDLNTGGSCCLFVCFRQSTLDYLKHDYNHPLPLTICLLL